MTTIEQRLATAESAMQRSRNPPQSDADLEIERVVSFMAVRDFKEAPEDADPALVALIRDVVDRV
jgi:Flp pilus assembly protein TadD